MTVPTPSISNRHGVSDPDFQVRNAESDVLLRVPLDTDALEKFFSTKNAVRANKTNDLFFSKNEALFSWRNLVKPGNLGARSRSLVTLDGTRKRGPVAAGANAAQEGQYKGSAMVLDAGTFLPSGIGIRSTASPSRARFPTAAAFANGVGVVGLWEFETYDTPGTVSVFARAADGANRFSATYVNGNPPTVGGIRTVASTATAEAAATTVTKPDMDNVYYVAIGLRMIGTTYAVFHNGKRINGGTLNAAAQALAGNGVGFDATGNNHRATLIIFDAFSLAA